MLWRTWSSMTSVIRAQEVRHSRDYFWCTAVPSIVCRNVLRKRRGCPPRHAKDQRDLTKLCDERAPAVTDLPIDRIAQVVPTAERLSRVWWHDHGSVFVCDT
jgi:hypothetical protein